jgi:hypothetical protein
MVDQVYAHGVVASKGSSYFQLGAYAVSAGDQHGLLVSAEFEESTKKAYFTEHPRAGGETGKSLYDVFGSYCPVNINASSGIGTRHWFWFHSMAEGARS